MNPSATGTAVMSIDAMQVTSSRGLPDTGSGDSGSKRMHEGESLKRVRDAAPGGRVRPGWLF
jgi:hypothetical protein